MKGEIYQAWFEGKEKNMRTKKLVVLFSILAVVLLSTGCTAAWIGSISALLPSIQTIVTAIAAFVLALQGKTVSSELAASIEKIANDIKLEIANAQAIITAYKSSSDQTLLGKLTAVFDGIVTSLGSILEGAEIADPATVSKITQLVGLAVAAVQAILGFIPLVENAMENSQHMSKADLEHADKAAANLFAAHKQALERAYNHIVMTNTGRTEVDKALAGLPHL